MRIAFVHDWKPDMLQALTWNDGLCAALCILSERHDLRYFTVGDARFDLKNNGLDMSFVPEGGDFVEAVRAFEPDVILHWADATRPHAEPLKTLGKPMALCFAGGNPFGPTWHLFDHIFVESQSYKMQYENRGMGHMVSTAFGTNTKLFDPQHAKVKKQAKIFDVANFSTYCAWKRHDLLASAVQGYSVVCAGYKYDDHETECWQVPLNAGFLCLPHLSPEALRTLFAASRTCVLTSHWTGGSQRTVLEAMAMEIPLIVMSDSDKTSEYVLDCGEGFVVPPDPVAIKEAVQEAMYMTVKTRPYILENWSEYRYAENLEKGLKKICA